MKKKNRPLQAANSDIRQPDITLSTNTEQVPKRTPKKHPVRIYMLNTEVEGWTENDILRYCHLSFGLNYASELERQLINRSALAAGYVGLSSQQIIDILNLYPDNNITA